MPYPTIELSMIVKDGGASLARCLRSARPFVDRILIGDTGSSDDSRAIAESFGAEVISIPWADDFAAARNHVLEMAKCDWVLVLDADEMLDPAQAASLLPSLVRDEKVHAYTLTRHDYVESIHRQNSNFEVEPNSCELPESRPYPGYVTSLHTRLFRRNPEVQFRECVHEQITDSIDRLALLRNHAPLTIHHFGMVEMPANAREEKIKLYHRLGQQKLAKEPGNFEAHLQLGIAELYQMNRLTEALLLLQRATALRPHDGRGPLYTGVCLLRLGRFADARQSLLRAFALGEDSVALHDAMGDTLSCINHFEAALTAYQRAHLISNASPLAQAKIGVAEVQLGEVSRGLERMYKALERDPESVLIRKLLETSEMAAASSHQAIA